MAQPSDDDIMEGLYEKLRRISLLREPKDSRKRAAFLLARKMLNKAREYLEEPYRQAREEREGVVSPKRRHLSWDGSDLCPTGEHEPGKCPGDHGK